MKSIDAKARFCSFVNGPCRGPDCMQWREGSEVYSLATKRYEYVWQGSDGKYFIKCTIFSEDGDNPPNNDYPWKLNKDRTKKNILKSWFRKTETKTTYAWEFIAEVDRNQLDGYCNRT